MPGSLEAAIPTLEPGIPDPRPPERATCSLGQARSKHGQSRASELARGPSVRPPTIATSQVVTRMILVRTEDDALTEP
jgi:hypothetical protein